MVGSAFQEESMVSLSERDELIHRAKADTEMRAVYAFLFGESIDYSSSPGFPHISLLRAVAERDKTVFLEEIKEFRSRRTSEGSTWYDNDCLVFLLIVGGQRLQIDLGFLDPILNARDTNPNPIPKRVNEVFWA